MSIWLYIIYLGILTIVFTYGWRFVALLLSLVFALVFGALKIDIVGPYLMRAISYYLLTSVIGLFTLAAIGQSSGWFAMFAYALIGALTLFICIGQGMYESRKEAAQDYNLLALKVMESDGLFLIGAMVLYVVILFFPLISSNIVVSSIFIAISWVSELPIIGLLLGIGGFLYLLSIGFYVLIFSISIAGSLWQKFFGAGSAKEVRVEALPQRGACRSCGTENAESSLFCKSCGNKLDSD